LQRFLLYFASTLRQSCLNPNVIVEAQIAQTKENNVEPVVEFEGSRMCQIPSVGQKKTRNLFGWSVWVAIGYTCFHCFDRSHLLVPGVISMLTQTTGTV
jgi:hypothetical protein